VTDSGWIAISRLMPDLKFLSASGSSKMTDKSIVAFAHHLRHLDTLEVEYCPLLTNVSLRALHFYARKLSYFRAGGSQMDDQLARKWTQETGHRVSAKADFYD
jgi:hypothetical protein